MIEAVEKEHMLEGQHIVKKTHKGEIDMDEDLSTLEVLCNLLENGWCVIFMVIGGLDGGDHFLTLLISLKRRALYS